MVSRPGRGDDGGRSSFLLSAPGLVWLEVFWPCLERESSLSSAAEGVERSPQACPKGHVMWLLSENCKTPPFSSLGWAVEMRNSAADWKRTTLFNLWTADRLVISRISLEKPHTFLVQWEECPGLKYKKIFYTCVLCDPALRRFEGVHVHLKLWWSSLWNRNSLICILYDVTLGKQSGHGSDPSAQQPPVMARAAAGGSLPSNWLLSLLMCPGLGLSREASCCVVAFGGRRGGRQGVQNSLPCCCSQENWEAEEQFLKLTGRTRWTSRGHH